MKRSLLLAMSLLVRPVAAADFRISSFDRQGSLNWTNASLSGVCTVEAAARPNGQWQARQSYFTTGSAGQITLSLGSSNEFYRLVAVDISTNTPEGSQLLYVDAAGVIHVFLDGKLGHYHNGDGQWFRAPGPPKICELRAVTLDRHGNILIVENDFGYVRKIELSRQQP